MYGVTFGHFIFHIETQHIFSAVLYMSQFPDRTPIVIARVAIVVGTGSEFISGWLWGIWIVRIIWIIRVIRIIRVVRAVAVDGGQHHVLARHGI